MGEGNYFAVLTGDLVKSSRLSEDHLSAARRALLAAVDEVKRWGKGLVRSKPDFFRGDAWQTVLADPRWSLRAALFLRARLKSQERVDTRVAIGIGRVQTVSPTRASLSSGEAFRLSGESLDQLAGKTRLAISLAGTVAGDSRRWLPVVFSFCDAIASQWKPRQSEIVAWALLPDPLTYEGIAASLTIPVSKQAVAKSLAGARWQAIKLALDEFERTSWASAAGST